MNQAYEELEELAKQFKKDTGLLAPFKDEPTAVGNDPHYNRKHRQQEFDNWLINRTGGRVVGSICKQGKD